MTITIDLPPSTEAQLRAHAAATGKSISALVVEAVQARLAFACLKLAETREVALGVSPDILAEIRDVLARPTIRKKLPSLTDERVDLFLQKITALGTVVTNAAGAANYSIRDPDDLPYLDLAVAIDARYLVSRDKDLPDLMDDREFVSGSSD